MFLGFGEIMMRVAPEHRLRWRQCLPGRAEITWGGGEANVCAALALWQQPARFLTALPRNVLAESLVTSLRGLGVDTSSIVWRPEGRLGVYYVEAGANQRGSTVLYDRAGSVVSLAGPDAYDFDSALQDVHWLHLSGITPAISEAASQANLALVRAARQRGVTISCDLNFRKKLWTWRPSQSPKALARDIMPQVLAEVDVVIANEEDAADVLDIHAQGTDVTRGQIDAAAYQQVARDIVARFPQVQRVAITLRESISADHNNWGAMLYEAQSQQAHFAPLQQGRYQPYAIHDIVDRVGSGDSFAAGLLYALNSKEWSNGADAIRFAVAASCLKHSIQGDFNYVSVEEVVALAGGNASGRVQR